MGLQQHKDLEREQQVRFLLGQLPDEERAAMERRYLAEPALEVEDELCTTTSRGLCPPNRAHWWPSAYAPAKRRKYGPL